MSESSESLFNTVVSEIPQLTNGELDQQLETATIQSEKAELLICCYLSAVGDRQAYRDFGYTSITDYAQARFGFEGRKTRYLVSLSGAISSDFRRSWRRSEPHWLAGSSAGVRRVESPPSPLPTTR